MRVLYITLELWESIVDNNNLTVFEKATGNHLAVWAGGDDVIYRADVQSSEYGTFDAKYPTRVTADGEDEAIARILNTAIHTQPKQSDGARLVALAPRVGSEVVYTTHNFADKTTWYTESVRVTGETLSTADNLTYTSAHTCWIDLDHGKLFDEDGIREDQAIFNPGDPHGYAVKVYVDGVLKTPRAPYAAGGGDYTVDYSAGTVTFSSSQAGTTVTSDYSYAAGSSWIMQPIPGKTLVVEASRVMVTHDFDMDAGTLYREYRGYVEVFAPSLAVSNGGAIPDGTRIVLERTNYLTMAQLMAEAHSTVNKLPALGGTQRGTSQDTYGFIFRYGTRKDMPVSTGLQIHVGIDTDTEYSGELAIATFYCTSQDEV